MSRAFDDVFSESMLDVHPHAIFKIHVMRDPAFQPNGVALEVAPAGVPHVTIEDPATCGGVLIEWDVDSRSRIEPHEELRIEAADRTPEGEQLARLTHGIGDRTWHGVIEAEAVRTHEMNDEVRAFFDARRFPRGDHWRVAWSYDLVLIAPGQEVEDRIGAWVVIETA